MDEEQKEVLREYGRRRGFCPKCNGLLQMLTGLNDEAHFPQVIYLRCNGCGYETVKNRATKVK